MYFMKDAVRRIVVLLDDMLQLQCTTTEFSSQVEDLMNNILVLLMTKGQKRQDLK